MIVGEKPTSCFRSLSLLIAVVGAAASTIGAAQTLYKITDKDGQITYTDVLPASEDFVVEEVSVPQPNTAMPVVPGAGPLDGTSAVASPAPDYLTLISLPADGTTIAMGPGDFEVEAQASPALGIAERLQLEVDGAPFGAPQTNSRWQLSNIARGAHGLRVMRLDELGQTIDTSDTSTVYVLRPSVLN